MSSCLSGDGAIIAGGDTVEKKTKGVPPAVLLWNPKLPHNVGAALRACSCWGLEQLWWSGHRVTLDVAEGERLPREERMKGYRNVEMTIDDYPFDRFESCTPVAVELLPGSENIVEFQHPKDALYVFGPEDGSIPQVVRRHCHRFIFMPTHHCLNLAAAVNIVLYDRRVKAIRDGTEPNLRMDELLKEHRGPVWAREK